MITWILRLVLASTLAIADNTQAYNLTLTDQSPAITYFPSRSGAASESWNVSYSNSSWSSYTQGAIGDGQSNHYTTYIGASASLAWTGSAIYVFGGGENSDYQIVLDGKNHTSGSADGYLAVIEGLSYGKHNLTLLVTGDGGVQLSKIKLGLNMGSTGNTQNATWGNGAFNPSFDTSVGQWEAATQLGEATPGPGAAPAAGSETYDRIDTHTPGSILSLQPPLGTTLVVLYGSINYDHGNYTVSLSSKAANSSVTYDGYSPWADINQVTYYGILRSDTQYVVQVEFEGTPQQYWDIAQAIFVSANTNPATTTSNSLNVPAIVGGVLGGAAVLVIAAGFAYLAIRKRRQTTIVAPTRPVDPNGPFEIDEPYKEEPLTDGVTYYHDPQMAYANAAAGAASSFQNPANSRITPLFIPAYVNTAATEPSEYLAESPSRATSISAATTPFADGVNRRDSYPAGNTSRRAADPKRWSTGSGQLGEPSTARYDSMRAAERKARLYEEERRRSMRQESEEEYQSEEVVQEQDAGRVMIPPTYDPSWNDHGQEIEGSSEYHDSRQH